MTPPSDSAETSLAALGDEALGLEGRALASDHAALRLWLRLLACTTDIETEIRRPPPHRVQLGRRPRARAAPRRRGGAGCRRR